VSPRAFAAAALLATALPAGAFVRTAACPAAHVWWGGAAPNVRLDVNVSGFAHGCASSEQVLDAVRASFPAWSQPCSDLVFDVSAVATTTADVGYVPGAKNDNLVVFRSGRCSDEALVPANDPCRTSSSEQSCADRYNCWDDQQYGPEVIALTTLSYDANTGEILDADMELRGWDGQLPGVALTGYGTLGHYFTCGDDAAVCSTYGEAGCRARDVRNVATHEAGHMLGLGHTPVTTATMYATSSLGEIGKRILGADDVAGVCAIYPNAAPTAVDGTCGPSGFPQETGSGGCGQAGSGAGVAGFAMAIAGLLVAQRRRAGVSPPPRP
jgi:Matrixin